MSKFVILAIAALLAAVLFAGVAQAQNPCNPYYYYTGEVCIACPRKCSKCSDMYTCLPGYCDIGSTFFNGLCHVTVVTPDAVSRTGLYAAVATLCAMVVALVC